MNKLKRILTIKVVLLLIGISVLTSANEINNKIEEKSIEYPVKEQVDEYKEIISFIHGTAFSVDKTGFIFSKQIYITPWKTLIYIIGIRTPSSYILDMFYFLQPDCIVKIYHFFGSVKQQFESSFDVSGIAIGNIEFLQ